MLRGTLNGGGALSGAIQREFIAGGVGTSDYEKLDNKPSINGVELVGNKMAEELGIVSEESDPTVPSHVKNITEQDISGWNNKSEFSGSYADLTDKPDIPEVPENVSAFNNDAGYVTVNDVKDKADKSYVDTKVADLVNSAPETLDTLGEVAKAIQDNESVVDALNSAIGSKADKTELTDYVKFTDYAGNSVKGVVDVRAAFGMMTDQYGRIQIVKATEDEIKAKANEYHPLVAKDVDLITKTGLTTNALEWSDEEKASARALLGIDNLGGIPVIRLPIGG